MSDSTKRSTKSTKGSGRNWSLLSTSVKMLIALVLTLLAPSASAQAQPVASESSGATVQEDSSPELAAPQMDLQAANPTVQQCADYLNKYGREYHNGMAVLEWGTGISVYVGRGGSTMEPVPVCVDMANALIVACQTAIDYTQSWGVGGSAIAQLIAGENMRSWGLHPSYKPVVTMLTISACAAHSTYYAAVRRTQGYWFNLMDDGQYPWPLIRMVQQDPWYVYGLCLIYPLDSSVVPPHQQYITTGNLIP